MKFRARCSSSSARATVGGAEVKPQPDEVLSHDLSMEEFFFMFGPVVTTVAHLAFAGARVHSNNTAEIYAIVEALCFLGPMARLPVMRVLVFSMNPSMLLMFAWSQFMLARPYSFGSRASRYC